MTELEFIKYSTWNHKRISQKPRGHVGLCSGRGMTTLMATVPSAGPHRGTTGRGNMQESRVKPYGENVPYGENRWKANWIAPVTGSHSFTQPPSCPNNHLTFSGYVSVQAEKGPHLTPLQAHHLEKTESHRRRHTLDTQRCKVQHTGDSSPGLETLGSAVSPGCSRREDPKHKLQPLQQWPRRGHSAQPTGLPWRLTRARSVQQAPVTSARPGSLPPSSCPHHSRGHSSGMRDAHRAQSTGLGVPREWERGTGSPLLWTPSSPRDTGLSPTPGEERPCQAGKARCEGHPRTRGWSPEAWDQALCQQQPRACTWRPGNRCAR